MDLKKRIAEIAYKHKLSHLGSYFSSLEIIEEIYKEKSEDDIFILSSGHAALALYVVMEKYEGTNAEEMFLKHGGHPHRDEQNKIYCSTGSLGLGLLVAILSNKFWSLSEFIKESKLGNIKVYVNINGYAAYDAIDVEYLEKRLVAFLPDINLRRTNVSHYSFLCGLNAHYHVMKEDDYKEVMES